MFYNLGLRMGLKQKTKKGEISIINNHGSIRLRWRHKGHRYTLHLPLIYSQENLSLATIKAAEIKLDILKGYFDTSLKKYNDIDTSEPNLVETITNRVVETQKPAPMATRTPTYLNSLVSDFIYWTKNIKNIELDKSIDYTTVKNTLEKWIGLPVDNVAELLNIKNWKPTTYNKRLKCLHDFFEWLVKKEGIKRNPLDGVTRKRKKKNKDNLKRSPLSEEEISKLLDAVKNDTYCPSASKFKHSHYYPFLYFMFLTGVRNAEAIGLRVRHVDLSNNQIEISETFARTLKGSNHAARIDKGTKMDNVRYLPLTAELRFLLVPLIWGKDENCFVFKSPKGLSIDDRMLQRRVLKPVLKSLKLGERDLYVARHSFGTRAAQQGMPISDIAYLMGHSNIETAMRNYIHTEKAASKLPELKGL